MIELIRGDIMGLIIRFMRFILIVGVLVASFIGGWYTYQVVNQNPFLATFLQFESKGYQKFINDIADAVQFSNIEVSSLPFFESQYPFGAREVMGGIDKDSLLEEESMSWVALDPGGIGLDHFRPESFTQFITHQLSNKEKVLFMLWLHSRFDQEEIELLNHALYEDFTLENTIEVYRNLRKNLRESDYEYLLSILDRYILMHQDEVLPMVNSQKEYGYTMPMPYGGIQP